VSIFGAVVDVCGENALEQWACGGDDDDAAAWLNARRSLSISGTVT